MFRLFKARMKRIFAGVLAALIVFNCMPVNYTVYAATITSFNVELQVDGATETLDGVSVTLTEVDDPSQTQTQSTTGGIATFTDFVDDGKNYTLSVANINGYESVVASTFTPSGTSQVVSLTKLTQITISGKVINENSEPYGGATVNYSSSYGSGSTTTNDNGEYTFTAYAGKDYTITADSGLEKYTKPSINVNTDSNHTCDDLKFAIKTFTIKTPGETSEGTTSAEGTVVYDGSYEATVSAKPGYKISEIKINEVSETITDVKNWTKTISNIKADQEIKVTYAQMTYKVDFTVGINGKVTYNDGNETQELIGGTVKTVTVQEATGDTPAQVVVQAIPDEGYRVSSVVIDGVTTNYIDNDKVFDYTFEMTQDHTFSVEFSQNGYNVSILEQTNGTVTCDKAKVETGGETKLTITPNDNYKVDSILVKTTSNTTGTNVDILTDLNYVENNNNTYVYTYKGVTEDVTFEVTFAEIAASANEWNVDVSLDTTDLVLSTSDSNTNLVYIYKKTATTQLESLLDTEASNANQIRAKYVKDAGVEEWGEWTESIEIDSSCVISEIQVREAKLNNVVNVNLSGKKLIIVIDKEVPSVDTVSAIDWTNVTDVTIKGTVSDSNTSTNPSSGIDYVVWSNGSALDEAGVLGADSENKAILDNTGAFSFKPVTGDQNSTYYIYAVDKAGNISVAKTTTVKIDATAPTITDFQLSVLQNEVKTDPINDTENGIFCAQTMYLTITASDGTSGSGVDKITLYIDGKNPKTATVDNNSKAQFELTTDDFSSIKTISAKATDKVENTMAISVGPTLNSKYKSDKVQISSNTTGFNIEISAVAPEGSDTKIYKKSETEIFANKDNVDFDVVVEESVNGLAQVKIAINDGTPTDSGELNNLKKYETSVNAKDGVTKAVVEVSAYNMFNKNATPYTQKLEVKVDATAPTISKFEFEKVEPTTIDKILKILTFGIYSNDKVKITVTAVDEGTASGVKSIALYGNGQLLEAKNADENNEAEFIIPLTEILENKVHFNQQISAKATDNVGNETITAVIPTVANSNAQSNGMMIENIKPEVSIGLDATTQPLTDINASTSDGKNIFADDKDAIFNITAEDGASGLYGVTITVNGTTIVEETGITDPGTSLALLTEKTYSLTLSGKDGSDKYNANVGGTNKEVSPVEGKFEVIVEVTDNAGNIEKKTDSIYRDTIAPSIVNFTFSPTGTVEKDATNTTVKIDMEQTNYGFYFRENTEVTVHAQDIVGVNKITYYTVDINNTKSAEETIDAVKNGENDTISFQINAGFKGQIFVKPVDNAGNAADDFVTPDGAIVETQKMHDDHSKTAPHIILAKPTAPYKANNNVDLFTTKVPVTITIADSFSGIRSVKWTLTAAGAEQGSGEVAIGDDKAMSGKDVANWSVVEEEANTNLVTKIERAPIEISNTCNDIVLEVEMQDRAGNVSKENYTLNIDTTAPVVSVEVSGGVADSANGDYFRSERMATITIKENNFDPNRVQCSITNSNGSVPSIGSWQRQGGSNDATYVATVVFADDGHYSISVGCTDLAGNVGASASGESFTVDVTNPTVEVTYDNNSAVNGNYYSSERTATVTVTEHNFDPGRVSITGTAVENGTEVAFPVLGGWASNGDTHTATLYYSQDAHYTFDIDITDKAGNVMEDYQMEEFVVDKTAPSIEFSGVADKSANNGEVIPVITYTDMNFDRNNVSIVLTGINNGQVNYPGYASDIANGQRFAYSNFGEEKAVDDIYTLEVTLTDMAGNATTSSITFSVNRHGSVYDMTGLKDLNGSYSKTVGDIVFTETNVDTLERETIRIRLTKNGTPTDLTEGSDYIISVSGGEGQWNKYTYTLDKALFTDDGKYSIAIYSKDLAGNINENIDEEKEAEITFGVDSTAPVIVPIDLEEGKQYAVEMKTVSVEIKDNLILQDVKIYVDGKETEYTVEGESYIFNIYESTDRQNIRIVATDVAGNQHDVSINDVLVTTSVFARFYNNTPLFVGTIIAVAVVVVGGAGFIVFGGKRKLVKK